jgi:hypothetical protein
MSDRRAGVLHSTSRPTLGMQVNKPRQGFSSKLARQALAEPDFAGNQRFVYDLGWVSFTRGPLPVWPHPGVQGRSHGFPCIQTIP